VRATLRSDERWFWFISVPPDLDLLDRRTARHAHQRADLRNVILRGGIERRAKRDTSPPVA
jgi:hypothetical protein